ncbi:MAG: GNAT family N-acetyltransferase [Chloroflexi bacterium]|nr:MAG: GNAT family N-acetyltransferase [Chloroflexota bacterium]
MAAGLVTAQQTLTGLQPMQLRRDLAAIADLIEYAFAPSLDAAGRSAIQEMRLISRTGALLWALGRLNKAMPGLSGGFVWYESGRLVGNVSISPAESLPCYGKGWVIANVAVYPEFRRRGIARRLMQASLDWITRHGTFATLQVEADNPNARALYESMGFITQRSFIRWRRPISHHFLPPMNPADIRPLIRRDSARLFTLAERVRPNESGGLGWLRPTEKKRFRPPRLGGMLGIFNEHRMFYWGVPSESGAELDGALLAEQRFGLSTVLFDVLVAPEHQGELGAALVNHVIRAVAGRHQPLVTDHPADDSLMADVLKGNGFVPERELVHMLWR